MQTKGIFADISYGDPRVSNQTLFSDSWSTFPLIQERGKRDGRSLKGAHFERALSLNDRLLFGCGYLASKTF